MNANPERQITLVDQINKGSLIKDLLIDMSRNPESSDIMHTLFT